MISHSFLVALSLQLLGLVGQVLSKSARSQRLRNRSDGTGGRVPKGSLRRLSGAGGSPGHRGSLVVVVRRPPAARPARSIAYAAIAYFLGNCCAFGQLRLLLTFCAIAAHFLGNSGLLVASGAHGGWWAAGTSGQVGGSLRNPGWQGGSGGSGGRGYRRTGGGSGSGGGVPLGRCGVPLGRLGPLRGAAGRCRAPWAP